jgi:hypothetical protein
VLLADNADRACPEEGIENPVAGHGRGQYTVFHQPWWKGRKVSPTERLGRDGPHGPAVPAIRPLCGLMVVEVLERLGQQEYVLVRARRPVSNALGHAVGLLPDNVTA